MFECFVDADFLSSVLVSELCGEDVCVGFLADLGDVDAADAGWVFVADDETERVGAAFLGDSILAVCKYSCLGVLVGVEFVCA